MDEQTAAPTFRGDQPVAAEEGMLRDRRELALVAVERTRMPMVISDPKQPDNPVVFANQAFLDLTGYDVAEVLGRNCRFLQGAMTASEDVAALRDGLAADLPSVEREILNYRKDGSAFWNQLAISPVHDSDGSLLYYFASQKDVTSRRQAQALEASEKLLLKEVDHRALNALAIVKSVVALSNRSSVARFAEAFDRRVDALARAHRLLAQASWAAVGFRELIGLELPGSAVSCLGDPVKIPAHIVQPLSLALHELASNARTHGALSQADGELSITSHLHADTLTLEWAETGIARLTPEPPPPGLGLALVKGIIEQQLAGTLSTNWGDDSLTVQISIPRAR